MNSKKNFFNTKRTHTRTTNKVFNADSTKMFLFLRDSKIEFYRPAPTDTEMRNKIVNKKVCFFYIRFNHN